MPQRGAVQSSTPDRLVWGVSGIMIIPPPHIHPIAPWELCYGVQGAYAKHRAPFSTSFVSFVPGLRSFSQKNEFLMLHLSVLGSIILL